MTKPIFYEGQQVGCLMYGEGIIQSIGLDFIYVIVNEVERTYYFNGKYYENARPTLYPIEQYRAIIANLPAPEPEKWQPKPGEWCWFWDDGYECKQPVLSQFHSVEDGLFKGTFYLWQYCAPFTGELPEHLKEVQP